MDVYEQTFLELTDRVSEFMNGLPEHRCNAMAVSPEERAIYIDDLKAWCEVFDAIASCAITGTEYRNRSPVLFW